MQTNSTLISLHKSMVNAKRKLISAPLFPWHHLQRKPVGLVLTRGPLPWMVLSHLHTQASEGRDIELMRYLVGMCLPEVLGEICRGSEAHAPYPAIIETVSQQAKLQPLDNASLPWHPPHHWACCPDCSRPSAIAQLAGCLTWTNTYALAPASYNML